jgi:hypothetical protein
MPPTSPQRIPDADAVACHLDIAARGLRQALAEARAMERDLHRDRDQACIHSRILVDILDSVMKTLEAPASALGAFSNTALAPNVFTAFTRADTLADLLKRRTAKIYRHEFLDALMSSLMRGQQDIDSILASLTVREESMRPPVNRLAGRVADAAARLLPCGDRLRYVEEYRAELYELALCSRRGQWAYAVRLLACALPLRRELRRDAREVVQGQ